MRTQTCSRHFKQKAGNYAWPVSIFQTYVIIIRKRVYENYSDLMQHLPHKIWQTWVYTQNFSVMHRQQSVLRRMWTLSQ